MQPEGLIEHDHLLLRNADARPQPVIIRLAVRHHHIQPIDGAALKHHHQHLAARARRCRLRMQGTGQKCWNHRSADERKGTMTKKDTPGQGHGEKLLWPSLTRLVCSKLRSRRQELTKSDLADAQRAVACRSLAGGSAETSAT